MKITKFLMAILLLVPFLQACQEDISDLDDPRDAIAKEWRVTDDSGTYTGTNGYDVTIYKDANDVTKVYFGGTNGFHALDLTDKLYATIAGNNLTIASQVVDGGDYTIRGTGVISSDSKRIDFHYFIKPGSDPEDEFNGDFGPKIVKKKAAKPAL